MIAKEQIIEILAYCKQNNVTHKEGCTKFGVSQWSFYESKRRYIEQEKRCGDATGEFVQLKSDGSFVPSTITSFGSRNRVRKTQDKSEGMIVASLEVQGRNGSVMRYYGELSAGMLTEIVKNL